VSPDTPKERLVEQRGDGHVRRLTVLDRTFSRVATCVFMALTFIPMTAEAGRLGDREHDQGL
jgi:hypothetical protein